MKPEKINREKMINPEKNKSILMIFYLKKRINQKTVKDDSHQDFSVGIKDIDESIHYYFNNVIRPTVLQNGKKKKGLTAKQKKLPPALRAAILKKQRGKK